MAIRLIPEESRGEGAVFVPMARGFVYLVAVIDCFSREVLISACATWLFR
jgi:hypothetical protein